MKQPLSTRSIAVLAVCIATASAVISWCSATRYLQNASKYACELAVLESDVAELKHHVLGMGALVHVADNVAPESNRITPTDPRIVQWCKEIEASIPRLRTFEAIRADQFLYWYYRQMKALHPCEPKDSLALAANDRSTKPGNPGQNDAAPPGFADVEGEE